VKKTKKKIEFSSHTGNLALLRNYVRSFLESFPFSERQRTLMVLGVDEACTNIIRYAYQRRDDQLISLSLEGKNDCVCLRLRDYGQQADPSSVKSRPTDLIRPGGLGVYLIRNAFDRVDYVMRRRGTELVLTKNLE
jgi:serine/threonine-protein kinase RsbW